ncbi:hypothetical protein KCP70_21275 [Salmonella enterica subsp. enterica]|nr:hypothetical protein KCP70_21275 [Salmonella enterica subsp. enterica]
MDKDAIVVREQKFCLHRLRSGDYTDAVAILERCGKTLKTRCSGASTSSEIT